MASHSQSSLFHPALPQASSTEPPSSIETSLLPRCQTLKMGMSIPQLFYLHIGVPSGRRTKTPSSLEASS